MNLIAVSPILYQSKQYMPGDELPANCDMVEAWIRAGSVVWKENSSRFADAKAKMVTALPGLIGDAANSDSKENMVGRIPQTGKRQRK